MVNTIFTITEKQTLRRFRSGGESAHRSLNVICWRHTVEYGSHKIALILWLFWESHEKMKVFDPMKDPMKVFLKR